jgi:hypothetical protein
MRRLLGALVVVGAPVWYVRRRHRDHVHVRFDDGSSVTLSGGDPGTARLLAVARQAL